MHENIIATVIVNACFHIHKELGPGLLESVYERVLFHELHKNGVNVKCQVPIPVIWDNIKLDHGFRADLIVENKVLVEIKSIDKLAPVHSKQLLTYLRLTNMRLGLLVNFNESLIKNGLHRIVNGLI